MTAADAKMAIQEMVEYSQKWHNGTSRGRSTETSDGLTAIQAQLNNLGRPFQGGGYRAQVSGTSGTMPNLRTRTKAHLREDTLSKFMSESAKRHKENSNLIKEIRAMTICLNGEPREHHQIF
ncbi:hypothetical protein Tco_0349449 [Tanacetum coccineum]